MWKSKATCVVCGEKLTSNHKCDTAIYIKQELLESYEDDLEEPVQDTRTYNERLASGFDMIHEGEKDD